MATLEKIEMRKIVPIAAMISAGKSKLLNVLYNINFLECKAGIGTKFVNILRYNPSITEPIFYHLRVRKEGEEYVFYKDNLSEVVTGEKNIIEENISINRSLADEKDFNYENIFYMTEICDSPFIKDKKYLLTHDLCDIPGLSEYQESKTQEQNKQQNQEKSQEEKEKKLDGKAKLEEIRKQFLENEEKEIKNEENNEKEMIKEEEKKKNEEKNEQEMKKEEENKIEEKIEKKEEKKENVIDEEKDEEIKKPKDDKKEDDIFYKIKIDENTYMSEIFKMIKKYIDGAIIVLSIQNYYFESNFELIAKLHKVIEKEINNFLIVLNKADLSTNLKEDINKCKGLFMKYFPDCKTFNINLNTFIPISAIQLQNELLLDKSFKYLLRYHFYNYMAKVNEEKLINKDIVNQSFIEHLKDIIKTEKTITKEEIEKKVKGMNNPGIDDEILAIIKELKNDFKGYDFNFGITEEDFKQKENDDNDNLLDLNMDLEENTDNGSNTNIDDINPSHILKFLYIYQTENKLIPSPSEETYNLLNYFRVKEEKPKKEKPKENEKNEKTIINKRLIKNLKSIAKEIKKSKFAS